MIREFLFRAYLVAFACSAIMGFIAGWEDGFFTATGMALAVAVFWLIVGWICQPLFRNK